MCAGYSAPADGDVGMRSEGSLGLSSTGGIAAIVSVVTDLPREPRSACPASYTIYRIIPRPGEVPIHHLPRRSSTAAAGASESLPPFPVRVAGCSVLSLAEFPRGSHTIARGSAEVVPRRLSW